MKVVILGAGASYDSIYERFDTIENAKYANGNITGPNPEMRPPLGSQLFDTRQGFRKILNKHTGALAIFDDARLSSDIEIFLERIKDSALKSSDNHLAWQLISTQLYLRELLLKVSQDYHGVGSSNYSALIRRAYAYSKVKKEDVIFITFNYDILLERSIEIVTMSKFGMIDDYINKGIKIIKPHGSCNWIKKLKKITSVHSDHSTIDSILQKEAFKFISSDSKFEFENTIEVSENNDLNISNPFKNAIEHAFPQLAIPLKSKSDFVCPQEHLDVMKKALSNASEILIIGWKCGEIKFKDLLKESFGDRVIKVTVVDTDQAIVQSNLLGITKSINPKSFRMVWGQIEGLSVQHPIHNAGTFSSYIRNVAEGKFEDFFAL